MDSCSNKNLANLLKHNCTLRGLRDHPFIPLHRYVARLYLSMGPHKISFFLKKMCDGGWGECMLWHLSLKLMNARKSNIAFTLGEMSESLCYPDPIYHWQYTTDVLPISNYLSPIIWSSIILLVGFSSVKQPETSMKLVFFLIFLDQINHFVFLCFCLMLNIALTIKFLVFCFESCNCPVCWLYCRFENYHSDCYRSLCSLIFPSFLKI